MIDPKHNPHDKVIANSGWGVKPDDQPANAQEAASSINHYAYDPTTPNVVRVILRSQRQNYNTACRVVVEPGRTTIFDLNRDKFGSSGNCVLLS